MTLRMDFDFQLEKTLNCFLSFGVIDFCHLELYLRGCIRL